MRRHPRLFFSLGLVLALAVLAAVGIGTRTAQTSSDRASESRIKLARDVEQIRYYDELLTMSALAAAVTGDSSYVERYHDAVPKLDLVINDARSVALDSEVNRALSATDQANQALIVLEEKSFRQLAAGDRTGAYTTISSTEYYRLKDDYKQGMDTVAKQLELAGAEHRASATHRSLASWVASVAAGAMLILLWLLTVHGLRRSDRARGKVEDELRLQSLHDPLTGVANRTLLRDRIGIACRRRDRGIIVLLYVDVDDFKAVNDEHGHPAGDLVLIEVARRLENCVRPVDTVARLGGDEFAVLVESLPGPEGLPDLVRRLSAALSWPVDIGGASAPCGACIGSFTLGESDPVPDVEDVLRKADLAMYAAKRSRKGSWVAFEQSMHDEFIQQTQLKVELQRALEHQELVLHQPVVDLRTGAVAGVEALVRWSHPERGMLYPRDFVAAAEQTDMMPAITRWVLAEACSWAASRRIAKPDESPLWVAVNVSASELADSELTHNVGRSLRETGLDPRLLSLEVTETAVLGDIEASLGPIRSLRSLGLTIAVDDFGTGYSSLTHLTRLPIDTVKIDKSFVDGLGLELEKTHVVAGIIGLAHHLSLSVIAEGVETEEQLVVLRDLGCDYAQGFVLSRPAPGNAPLPSRHLTELVARVLGNADAQDPEASRYSIVIADDLESDRRLIRRALERSKRFTVVGEAADGGAAVRLAGDNRPDVVLLGINMPGGDGLTALPRILEVAPAIRVVMLSGRVTGEKTRRAFEMGASGVIEKSSIDIIRPLLEAIEMPVRRASDPSPRRDCSTVRGAKRVLGVDSRIGGRRPTHGC
ncbi:MAG: EAL domain-containing protein [Aeromicrobium sp.]